MDVRRFRGFAALLATVMFASACSSADPAMGDRASSILPDTSRREPANPPVKVDPEPAPAYKTAVLLFNGTGVSTSDWQNTEQIVKSMGLSYQLVNSSQLDSLTLDQIASFGTIIVPGGSGGTIAGNLSAGTRLRLRQAVRERGVGYVGFCAGAWVAVGPEAETQNTAAYGFAVAKGAVLDLFLPGGRAPTAAMVDVTFSASGAHRQLVWWGGPSTPEWAGGVVARYDSGEPAISETVAGKGTVVISGPHPEAPQGWRATAGTDSDGLDYDIAIAMIRSALEKLPMERTLAQ
ncbi:MAG: hypothetical protein NDJ89_12705 [Oligoflexia bacterium]|nr:hypothetical protein [Oligoflexia bacterium]